MNRSRSSTVSSGSTPVHRGRKSKRGASSSSCSITAKLVACAFVLFITSLVLFHNNQSLMQDTLPDFRQRSAGAVLRELRELPGEVVAERPRAVSTPPHRAMNPHDVQEREKKEVEETVKLLRVEERKREENYHQSSSVTSSTSPAPPAPPAAPAHPLPTRSKAPAGREDSAGSVAKAGAKAEAQQKTSTVPKTAVIAKTDKAAETTHKKEPTPKPEPSAPSSSSSESESSAQSSSSESSPSESSEEGDSSEESYKVDPYNEDHAALHFQASGSLLGAMRRHRVVNDFVRHDAAWYTAQNCSDLLAYFADVLPRSRNVSGRTPHFLDSFDRMRPCSPPPVYHHDHR